MKLSIITINFNNRNGLIKTMESVVCQNFTDYEYIIIDGASTDGSVEVLKQYYDKITYWVSESDKGIYNAMNKGISQAKGEYCLFLNSGDVLNANNVLSDFFSANFVEDIVYGKLSKDIDYPEKLRFSFMMGWSLPHMATFIKRTLFDSVGLYDESNRIISDWAFFMSALYIHHCTYRHIPMVISDFDESGISSSLESRQIISKERKIFLEKYFPLFIEDYKDMGNMRDELTIIKQSRIYKLFYSVRNLLKK